MYKTRRQAFSLTPSAELVKGRERGWDCIVYKDIGFVVSLQFLVERGTMSAFVSSAMRNSENRKSRCKNRNCNGTKIVI